MADAKTIYVDELIDRQSLTLRNYAIIALLLLALVCDGFDLQLVGVAAPWLADDWNLKPSALVGPVQSANLFGMMLGAIFLGSFGDRIGRKRIIVAGTLLFGLATLACLKTSSVLELGIVRFITGVGLGGVLPNVIALTAETTPRRKRAMLTSVVIIGMSLGSGMPGVVAAKLAPTYGWESLFIVGGVVPIVIAVLLALFLPESLQFLTNRGRDREQLVRRVQQLDPAAVIAADTQFALRQQAGGGKGSFRDLFSPGLRVTTPMLWIMFAGVLLAMHFLNSWISTVLKLGNLSPEQFSLTNSVFHWSGTIATIFTALLLGRLGIRWVLVLLLIGIGEPADDRDQRFLLDDRADARGVFRGLRRHRLPGCAECLGGPDLSAELPHHRRRRGARARAHRVAGRSARRRLRARPRRAGAADVLRAADSAGPRRARDDRAAGAQGRRSPRRGGLAH